MIKITDYGDFEEEYAEEVRHHFMHTNWPAVTTFNPPFNQPARWKFVYEVYNQSIEELYFWIMDNLQYEEAFSHFDKITDVYVASEQSAFFGIAQQRLGLQQDKVSQFLATIGKMVKELFQLVRELRIIDERMEYYNTSYQGDHASEITLKGYWIDLVEGGAKNAASVYGLARELQFSTLPDIFFASPPMPSSQVDTYVDSLDFNRKVKEVLKRKLKTFIVWKEHTHKELGTRRIFTIKYLRQHYDIIRMYMQWVKPYLKNIKRMHMDQSRADTTDIITAFEGSVIEIEVIAKKPFGELPGGKAKVWACMDIHIVFRTRPEMKMQQEGYQRGPIHVGRTVITKRCYTWTQQELDAYKKFREQEDFDILSSIDSSVKAAYTALGEELENYLKEAGEDMDTDKTKDLKPKGPSIAEPFISVAKGFGQIFGAFSGKSHESVECNKCNRLNERKEPTCIHCGARLKPLTKKESFEIGNLKDKANSYLQIHLFNSIKRFKAAHGFIYQ